MIHLINGIRSILFNLTYYPFTLIYCSIGLMPLCLFKSDKPLRKGIHIYCVGSLWLARWVMGIRHEYRGTEKLPKEGAFIFAAAHQSNMDPIMTFPLRNDLTALAKKQLFLIPFIGRRLRKHALCASIAKAAPRTRAWKMWPNILSSSVARSLSTRKPRG